MWVKKFISKNLRLLKFTTQPAIVHHPSCNSWGFSGKVFVAETKKSPGSHPLEAFSRLQAKRMKSFSFRGGFSDEAMFVFRGCTLNTPKVSYLGFTKLFPVRMIYYGFLDFPNISKKKTHKHTHPSRKKIHPRTVHTPEESQMIYMGFYPSEIHQWFAHPKCFGDTHPNGLSKSHSKPYPQTRGSCACAF